MTHASDAAPAASKKDDLKALAEAYMDAGSANERTIRRLALNAACTPERIIALIEVAEAAEPFRDCDANLELQTRRVNRYRLINAVAKWQEVRDA